MELFRTDDKGERVERERAGDPLSERVAERSGMRDFDDPCHPHLSCHPK